MKKKRRWLVLIPLILCAALTAAYTFLFVVNQDINPPVIHVDDEVLKVSVSAENEQLLKGVSAWDDVDQDVSDLIVIEDISEIASDSTAKITYAAFDASGNVAKTSRTLQYTDYTSPHFLQKRALVFNANSSMDVLSCIGAEDVLDGDLSSKVKGTLISDTVSLSYAGLHTIEFRVTNSMGETVRISLPVDVVESDAYNASVELSDYLVYVPLQSEFDGEDYLSLLKIGATEYALDDSDDSIRTYVNNYVNPDRYIGSGATIINVEMNSTVNTSVPGVYSVTYTVTLERGTTEYVGFSRLNVVVEE